MTAPYGFKFARSFDGSSNAAVKILPVNPGTGGIAVGDPITITSGKAVCAVGGDAVYGVCVSVSKTAAGTPVGGALVNAADPSVTALASGDVGYVAVVVADNAVFETVYLGETDSGSTITRAAAIGAVTDIGNFYTGSVVAFDSAIAHQIGGISKLGASVDGSGANSNLTIQGIVATGGTTSTRSIPSTYVNVSGNVTAGDVLLVTFNTLQHDPA
jgi:hypothetical protein